MSRLARLTLLVCWLVMPPVGYARGVEAAPEAAPAFGHLHEPLYTDMVRGLGAPAGEIEINSLVTETWTNGALETTWAPEVEVALFDGIAVELELPHVAERTQAIKSSFQLTLPGFDHTLQHGVQFIYEHPLGEGVRSATALYLLGVVAGRVSVMTMVGARVAVEQNAQDVEPTLAITPFWEAGPTTVLGFESNVRWSGVAIDRVRLLPQLHQSLGPHAALQLGVGMRWQHRDGAAPCVSVRLIVQ